MLKKIIIPRIIFIVVMFLLISNNSFAHCDSMEGPVVKASQKALETGNINYVLIWVKDSDEKEIKEIFDQVNKVRILTPVARELADMYFYETIVRVHRNGEGVGYTGLKPVGYKPEAGIDAADIAIEKNSVDDILQHLDSSKHEEVLNYFSDLQSKRNYNVNDLTAGREYVAAYVHFIHYVEGLFNVDAPLEEHLHHN